MTPLPSLDQEADWYTVSGPTPPARYDGDAWVSAVAAARRALAAEIIGTAERALELAVEHTSSRRQFNAPIAAFQAVRHRLADGYVAIAAARALLAASFGEAPGSATVAAAAAKARAAARTRPWARPPYRYAARWGPPLSTRCTVSSTGARCSTGCSAAVPS